METKKYKVREAGNSLIITLPVDIARKHSINAGDTITFKDKASSIEIEKVLEKEENYYGILDDVFNETKEALIKLADK